MHNTKRELKVTADGSHTFYLPEFDEHYHSTHGAIQEAKHIYIDAGFGYCSRNNISILEIGFGTGLNCLLTVMATKQTNKQVVYDTVELYPLENKQIQMLNYTNNLESEYQQIYQQIHSCDWNNTQTICADFMLRKIEGDIKKIELDSNYDLIYFDAFAPDVQPELWDEELFQKIYNRCNKGAILMTYCSKGIVKQALRSVGFIVKRLPGPLGKRHILRATKPE